MRYRRSVHDRGRSPADRRSASRQAAVNASDMSYWAVNGHARPAMFPLGEPSPFINLVSAAELNADLVTYSQASSLSWHF
jgi:hypothetical protein